MIHRLYSNERYEKKLSLGKDSDETITKLCLSFGEAWGDYSSKANSTELEEKWRYNFDREKGFGAWMLNLWYGSHRFQNASYVDFEEEFFKENDVKQYYSMIGVAISEVGSEFGFSVFLHDKLGNLLRDFVKDAYKNSYFPNLVEVEKYLVSVREAVLINRKSQLHP